MDADEKKVGEYVKRVRDSAGMNQTDFAKFLGVKQSFLSAVERGVRKPPKSWGIVLNKEFGVSENYLESGVITNNVVPQSSTPSGTPIQKMEKRGTTAKRGKKGLGAAVEGENDWQHHSKQVSGESARVVQRLVTASHLYKRYPEAQSAGMEEALALSRLGSDSDRILKHLHDTAYDRIDEVLDQVSAGSISMAAAAAEIQRITAPLDEIKDYFTAIETAVVNMARAAIELMPEVYNVVGYHIHEALSAEPDNEISVGV
jgi:DNA-binding XRE family transcriptional regulator